mmetsp:Transcript_47504/g.93685  ORF Transcript_47504/g.93685 Transcript_47504/m.93685 type:complete len:144 (-) Transcript_47504:2903-3334(-)
MQAGNRQASNVVGYITDGASLYKYNDCLGRQAVSFTFFLAPVTLSVLLYPPHSTKREKASMHPSIIHTFLPSTPPPGCENAMQGIIRVLPSINELVDLRGGMMVLSRLFFLSPPFPFSPLSFLHFDSFKIFLNTYWRIPPCWK